MNNARDKNDFGRANFTKRSDVEYTVSPPFLDLLSAAAAFRVPEDRPCDHTIGWYDDDTSGVEFLTTSEISEFASRRRAQAKSQISVATSSPNSIIRHHVALIAMSDAEIIESHICQFKFCSSCGETLQQISAQSAKRNAI